MNRPEIRSYDYVNQPFALVRDALVKDPASVFRSATRSAADRASSLASELRVSLAGVDVATEIDLTVGIIDDKADGPAGHQTTAIPIHWQAAHHPNLFPTMNAVLSLYPLTATETQLDFAGRYEPPLGVLGGVIDALVLRKVAEASVHRFVSDVAHILRDGH